MIKTPLRIRIFATLASVAMLLLCVVAIRALTLKPEVITNTSRIILPNDSLITLREELAAVRADSRARLDVLQATADARLETIRSLTAPLANISDTLLVLQRGIEAGNWAQRLAVERDRADRADRYQALKESADRVEQLQREVPDHFAQLEQNIIAILHRPPDTIVVSRQPRRRNLFNRIFSR